MALAIEQKADHIRVLSDLSGHVVGALLDEGERSARDDDPFSLALSRYREDGHPKELAGPWRNAIASRPIASTEAASDILRLLARDLLSCVAGVRTDEPVDRTETTAELPANVRPIEARSATIAPALEMTSDGTWRPSAAKSLATETVEAGRQQAHVPSMVSRYPVIRRDGPHVDLPAPPPASTPAPAAAQPAPVAAQPASEPAHTAAPAAAPTTTEPEDENVIRAVSGGIELIAGPFERFQELAAFTKALRELPGVHDVAIRQFVRGIVHIRVRHSAGVDLAGGLLTLGAFSPKVVSSTPSRIELQVGLPSDATPDGD